VARVRCCIGVRALLTVDSVGLGRAETLSHFGWCFSALRLPGTVHVSHFEGPSQHLAPAVNALTVHALYRYVT
jgi:hypothetical protein